MKKQNIIGNIKSLEIAKKKIENGGEVEVEKSYIREKAEKLLRATGGLPKTEQELDIKQIIKELEMGLYNRSEAIDRIKEHFNF